MSSDTARKWRYRVPYLLDMRAKGNTYRQPFRQGALPVLRCVPGERARDVGERAKDVGERARDVRERARDVGEWVRDVGERRCSPDAGEPFR